MKYIRTKYGIEKLDANREHLAKYMNGKQADTIEELCDEFVWVTPEGEHRVKPKTGDGLWYLCCDYKKGHQIYGAIWTDKGLIFVAKMNDKGDLELL